MRAKLGPINRAVAAILSLIWACAGMAGLAAAYASGHWLLALPALFAVTVAAGGKAIVGALVQGGQGEGDR